MDKIISLDDINELFKLKKSYIKDGYTFEGAIDKLDYVFTKENERIILRAKFNSIKTLEPSYDESMINIVDTIKSYYMVDVRYKPIEKLEKKLNKIKPNHVIFMLLDGLGINVLNNSLDKNDFLRRNIYLKIRSSYPSTTACAIPISKSGLFPLESAWIGWQNYFEEEKRNIVMFTGKDYYTGEDTNVNVFEKYLPYDYYFHHLGVPYLEVEPIFDKKNGVKDFEQGLNKTLEFIRKNERTFTYFYWDNPDYTLHEAGTFGVSAINEVIKLNNLVEEFSKKLPSDALLIITADHGHQDVSPIFLDKFKDLTNLLNSKPSLESRCMIFDVKKNKEKEFETKFNEYFKNIYKLYTTKEFLDNNYLGFGKKNPYIDKFLKTYVAVAISDYYFVYEHKKDDMIMKSHHAGMTKNEMSVPLILYYEK